MEREESRKKSWLPYAGEKNEDATLGDGHVYADRKV